MKEQSLSKGDRRRSLILNHLKTNGRITVQEIVDRFDCSEATARRDLDVLEKSESIIRTIGGAQYDGFSAGRETSFNEKKRHLWVEKEAIAAKAASLVEEGDIIGLTGGTTTFLIARAIKMMRNITVVTNAVNIAMELADSEDIQVVVSGGVMRGKSYELCGPLAEKTIQHVNIGKMFVGIDGITIEHGITTYSEAEAEIAKLLMNKASESIAVFDHSKAGRASLFCIAPLSSLHACVTDRCMDESIVSSLQQLNIPLYLAEGTTNNHSLTR